MRILIIDNNIDPDCWGSENLQGFVRKVTGAALEVRRAPQEDLPKRSSRFDGIIISGSKTSAMDSDPWVSKLCEFIRASVADGKAVLGVCFGHQLLARALGGDAAVRRAPRGEFGWAKIRVTEESLLLRGLPSEFHSFQSHFDEVCELPRGFTLKASSSICPVQACQLGEQPVFGIQFHPEKDLHEATHLLKGFAKNVDRSLILNSSGAPRLYDPAVGEKIFGNFLETTRN